MYTPEPIAVAVKPAEPALMSAASPAAIESEVAAEL